MPPFLIPVVFVMKKILFSKTAKRAYIGLASGALIAIGAAQTGLTNTEFKEALCSVEAAPSPTPTPTPDPELEKELEK